MNVTNKEFDKALIKVYENDPCGTLATAHWKTVKMISACDKSVETNEGEITALEAGDTSGLHIFWNNTGDASKLTYDKLDKLNFMIIHEIYFNKLNTTNFKLIKPYFRLIHMNKEVEKVDLFENFYFKDVNINTELESASELIGKCYEKLHPSTETVKSWTEHPVFRADLWLWIYDKNKQIPVALGIAEIDTTIEEGSLEWIQVLPEYHGLGLGKAMVLELLNRLKGSVKFTTVSGEVDNKTNPERLYRRCGFYGNDIWWLLRR